MGGSGSGASVPGVTIAAAPPGTEVVATASVPLDASSPDWVYVPLRLPAGVRRLAVSLAYPETPTSGPTPNAVDLGVFDERGLELGGDGFRGWSGGARDSFAIDGATATPGYLPGPLGPGTWHVVLAPYRVEPGGVVCRVRVSVELGEPCPAVAPAFPPVAVAGRGPGWYAADWHLHTVFSDGRRTPAELAAAARAAGLDVLGSSEHNTPAAHAVWGPLAGDDLLVLTGEEVTTRNGHLVAVGLDPGSWVDWRVRARDGRLDDLVATIHDRGGLAVAAHPYGAFLGGAWKFGLDAVDAVEVWNGPWGAEDELALAAWDGQLCSPAWRPAVGGSDAHGPDDVVGLPQTVVGAAALARDALVAAVRAGRCWVRESAGVDVRLTASGGGGLAGLGERLAVGPDEPVEVAARVTGVAGAVLRLVTDEGEVLTSRAGSDGRGDVRWSTTAAVTTYVRLEVRHPTAPGADGAPYGPVAALTNPVLLGR